MVDEKTIQEESKEKSLSALEEMIGKESPRLIRDRLNQISNIIYEKPSMNIVEYLEIRDLLNSNKRILKRDGEENLTSYQKEKIEAYKRLDEQLNTFSNFEEILEPEISDILSKKGAYRYWDKRIDAIQKYLSSENANPDMSRYFLDYVDNAIDSFTKKDGNLKAYKDPDTFNKLKELKKDISNIIYNQNNTKSLEQTSKDDTLSTHYDPSAGDDAVYGTVDDSKDGAKDDLDEILTEQTKIGPIKKLWRRLVDGAIGKLNGYYKVEDIYSKRTIEIAKSMGEYKELQIFAKELNENAKNSKEAIEYIKKIDENRGFLYTPDIKKIDLHSKYTIKNSERKEESLFTYKDFFTVKERLKAFLDGDIQVLKTTAGTFNEIISRSSEEGKSEIDTIASLLSAITLSNEAGKYGRIPKARLPHALM